MMCKEEKILLFAKESGDNEDILIAIKQISKLCLINDIDVDQLPMIDLISLFVKLRAISSSNIINIEYIDNEDKDTYDFDVDLDKLEIKDLNELKKIEIDEINWIELKYPKASLDIKLIDCIKSINGDFEYSDKELEIFLDELPLNIQEQLNTFSKKQPHLYFKVEYKNKNERNRKIELSSMKDFFELALTKRNLSTYYHMIMFLVGKHHWSLRDVEDLIPFERDVYMDLIQSESKKM